MRRSSSKPAATCERTLRVLHVEDNSADVELCQRELKRAGFEVSADVIQTPGEFAERLHRSIYDVILADYRLPGWTGLDALELLQQQEKDVPFVLVTGTLGEEAAVESIKRGAADYVIKDRLARLPVAVRRALEEKSMREERARTNEALRRAHDELEVKVRERTAELKATNEALLAEINQRKQADKELRQAKEAAERASRFKDQFLSMMSHELRTPLNAILGFSDLISDERYGLLNDRQRRYASHIRTGGQHLLKLINDTLDLSKIEAGRLELALGNFSVKSNVGEVLGDLQPLADKKSQVLLQEIESGLAVRADSMRFKQILMNLIGNAIKFAPEGGKIELSARRVNGEVRVEVRDNGPGIPVEEQKRVFEAFYRFQRTGEGSEGTGLGLAITQRLLELHGSQLGLESQPGQGSCFFFHLPAAERAPEPSLAQTGFLERLNEGLRVLVVEDGPEAVQLIQSQLMSAGFEVVVCDPPEAAAEIAARIKPDAITLNILMRPTNGWQILTQLRSGPATASIPLIVLTILDQPAVGLALGADEYLVKPVQKSMLLAAIDRCLAARGITRPRRPILVVEDNAATREFITELLNAEGHAVAAVADGAKARAWVQASLPELVILDLVLPKVSGLELLGEWRASPRTADLPVFVLTGKELTPEEEKYLSQHAELLVGKQQPWQEALIKQLHRVLTYSQVGES